MMKPLQTLFIAFLALSGGINTAQAAKASSLEDAYAKTKDKPIMVYCYAANFNESSDALYKDFIQRRKLIRGINTMTYLELPIYQNPSKTEQRKSEKALGKEKQPSGIFTLPSIIILDKDKNVRGYIRDPEVMRDAERANTELKKLITAYDKQQKLLKKADSLKSKTKSELIAEASDLGAEFNLSIPASASAAAASNDAGNKNGYEARFTYAFDSVLPILDKVEDNNEATKTIRQMMSKGKYSSRQQQEMLCILTGHLRRNGASASELRPLYQEMNKIDPKSAFGSYAEECIRTYCSE